MERKITDLQKELKKEVEVNEALHKKVNLLSELTSLPSEVEMLRKEVKTFLSNNSYFDGKIKPDNILLKI